MIHLSLTKERKYILIGGAILLFLGLVYRALPLFQGIYDGGTQIAAKEKQLAKFQRTIAEGEGLKTRLAALTSSLERVESGFLTGKTPSLAAVDMQNILHAITSKSGVGIKSMRVLKASKQDDTKYLSIPVRFAISPTVGELKEILYNIEISEKYLMVSEIRIIAPRRKNMEQLGVDMTVAGFMKESES